MAHQSCDDGGISRIRYQNSRDGNGDRGWEG